MTGNFTLNIWPGIAPGSESWKQQERVEKSGLGSMVYNVVTPTLSINLPKKTETNGTGIIIAPGGAFMILSIDHEGHQVAQWLNEKGIASFVLKYRVAETSPGMSFKFASGRKISMPETTEHSPDAGKTIGAAHSSGRPKIDIEIYGKYAIADGMQALKVVRSHAIEWGIDPNKVGFIGFSAGAIIAARALLSEVAEDRPNFVALIYGAPLNVGVGLPAGLPPVFLAWAQDDLLAGPSVLRLHDALRASGNYPEVHIFSGGGHGFGMRKSGPSGDNWIEILYDWLKAQGFAKPIVKWDMD